MLDWRSGNWVSGGSRQLVQFGVESNWQSVASDPFSSVILLKRDGTLWGWGTSIYNSEKYQGLRTFTPHRLGAKSDWVRLLRGVRRIYAWRRDGSAWVVFGTGVTRMPDLDHFQFQNLNPHPFQLLVCELGVRDDGTLWYWDMYQQNPRQIGKDSNWAEVMGRYFQFMALKTDGSIWKWNLNLDWMLQTASMRQTGPMRISKEQMEELNKAMDTKLQEAPAQVGAQHDWVGLGAWNGEAVTLSADGTLWRWPRTDLFARLSNEHELWLAPSRRPAKIENILDARE
jgi:alpha-tubulin suppressor-like RCC1 family protein